VIDEKAITDFRAGMDFDPGQSAHLLRNETREKFKIVRPQPVRDAMPPNRVQAGIAQQNFKHTARGWVALENRLNVIADGL